MALNNRNSERENGASSRRLKGIGVSRGIGKGNVVFLPPPTRTQSKDHLDDSEVEIEIGRFRSAVATAKHQLDQLASETDKEEHHRAAEIFSVHAMILESAFVDPVETLIKTERVSSESAVNTVLSDLSEKQRLVPDESFREKYLDIEDVATRLKRLIRGTRAPIDLKPNSVVVAREIRPSAVVELAKFQPAGLITEIGGWTSHMSIVAREFRLPMVTGIKNPETLLTPGVLVVVDGNEGEIVLDPAEHDVPITINTTLSENALPGRTGLATTADGVEVIIHANAEDPATYSAAKTIGVHGVGLYRSELLVGDDNVVPDHHRQAAAYAEMARATGDAGLSIRTFDISPEQFATDSAGRQGNPALGLRAIRAALTEPDAFEDQIRAILRAASEGIIDIILPMISNIEEIRKAKEIIASVKQDFPVARAPRIGVMIEVPSAVLIAKQIAANADFLCLGTNDLVQYLLAVDRDNDSVADWYQTLNPAVLAAINMVVEASSSAGIPLIVCGEMAGSPFYLPVLIGLGSREFSLNTNSIVPIRTLLSGISITETEALVKRLEVCETAAEIEAMLKEHYVTNWSHLFPERLLLASHR